MSDDPNTAADLFADDIMRIVMSRLSVRLVPGGNSLTNGGSATIDVHLVDNHTGYAYKCTGSGITLQQLTAKLADGSSPGFSPLQGGF